MSLPRHAVSQWPPNWPSYRWAVGNWVGIRDNFIHPYMALLFVATPPAKSRERWVLGGVLQFIERHREREREMCRCRLRENARAERLTEFCCGNCFEYLKAVSVGSRLSVVGCGLLLVVGSVSSRGSDRCGQYALLAGIVAVCSRRASQVLIPTNRPTATSWIMGSHLPPPLY